MLIDFDPQAQIASSFKFSKYDIRSDVSELLLKKSKLKDAIHPAGVENLFFIPGIFLSTNEDILGKITTENNKQLVALMKQVKLQFDYILIDCPPSLGDVSANVLKVSDSVIVPVQCEYYALATVRKVLQLIRDIKKNHNPKLIYRGFLITMVDLRSKLSRFVLERLRYTLKELVFDTMIPRNIRLAEVPMFGKPVQFIDNNSRGARSYSDLATEILNQDGTIESSSSKIPFKNAENF